MDTLYIILSFTVGTIALMVSVAAIYVAVLRYATDRNDAKKVLTMIRSAEKPEVASHIKEYLIRRQMADLDTAMGLYESVANAYIGGKAHVFGKVRTRLKTLRHSQKTLRDNVSLWLKLADASSMDKDFMASIDALSAITHNIMGMAETSHIHTMFGHSELSAVYRWSARKLCHDVSRLFELAIEEISSPESKSISAICERCQETSRNLSEHSQTINQKISQADEKEMSALHSLVSVLMYSQKIASDLQSMLIADARIVLSADITSCEPSLPEPPTTPATEKTKIIRPTTGLAPI